MHLYHQYNSHYDLLIPDNKANNNVQPKNFKDLPEVINSEKTLTNTIEDKNTEELLLKQKQQGYKRTSPMSPAQVQISKEVTLCSICKLQYDTTNKLKTHMKSHNQDNIYDMSSVQKVIGTHGDNVKTQETNKSLTCKHCELSLIHI